MQKKTIQTQLVKRTQALIKAAEEAYESTASFKESPDAKQESKYDTRGIESGYLAGAQARRVQELKNELQLLKDMPLDELSPGDSIRAGALIEANFQGKTRLYFLSLATGGFTLHTENGPVAVISVSSPMGQAMLGLLAGDNFQMKTGQETREGTILTVS